MKIFLSFYQEMVRITLSCLKQNITTLPLLLQAAVPKDRASYKFSGINYPYVLVTGIKPSFPRAVHPTCSPSSTSWGSSSHTSGYPSSSWSKEHPAPQIERFPARFVAATCCAHRHESALMFFHDAHPPLPRTELVDIERMCFKFVCL